MYNRRLRNIIVCVVYLNEVRKMNNFSKEQIGSDVCKSHLARTERDLYHTCPSKLSKRELSDLYFTLLEHNLELKKTINVQKDRIKVLSTQVQRMTAVQKNTAEKEKDCCASKAIVAEQKESLADLKRTNERMAERIRLLNMRLCSAKQFLKRTPSHASHPNKTSSYKFESNGRESQNQTSSLSDSNMRTSAVSCQVLDKDASARTTKTVATETAKPILKDASASTSKTMVTEVVQRVKEVFGEQCDGNKCRTIMNEFKEKIINLQKELSTTHTEYSQRIAKLESQVSELHVENRRVRSDHVASAHVLQQRMERANELQDKLRTAEAKCNELRMELSIERSKVSELETGLKVANMSTHVAKTIEQLAATKKHLVSSSPKTKDEVKYSKSDDSGCTDLNKSSETDDDLATAKVNQDLLNKVAELQTQLDALRISTAGEGVVKREKPKEFESYGVVTKDVDKTLIGNAEDEGSKAMNAEPVTEKNSFDIRIIVAEKDNTAEITPGQNAEASTSQPWEDSSDPGRSETLEGNVHNGSIDKKSIKEKPDLKVGRTGASGQYSFQIPGPIPVANRSQSFSKDKRKFHRNKQSEKYSHNELIRNKKSDLDDKTVEMFENNQDSCLNSDNQNKDDESIKEDTPNLNAMVANLEEYARDVETIERKSKDIRENKVKRLSILDRTPMDSLIMIRQKLEPENDGTAVAEAKKESDTNLFFDMSGEHINPASTKIIESLDVTEQATQIRHNTGIELCESHATVCRCPVLERRDVAVFRSCSGTLRFRTIAASDKLRRCGCRVQTDTSATQVDPPSPPPNRRDSATYTADALNGYTVQVEKYSRATSPDNTEHEISSLTDLPSEKDVKSPRGVLSPGGLSPGEEKATTTYTDTETHTDYGTLSEGEMPTVGKVRRLSAGEKPPVTARTSMMAGTSSEMMEATLQSISEELARCRQMLMSQISNERATAPYSEGPPKDELEHALRHSTASRRIADKHLPSCVFTLHIGTLVFSDEAVLYTRDKSLLLTWSFYMQNAAKTRVQSGRVVVFDFLMEYDVTICAEFLDYMKYADMTIVLCEMEKLDEPFAKCSLPLREALLHANRRADMSLALVSCLPAGDARDSVGEDIGVLDIWCTLTINASVLPTIHRAMRVVSCLPAGDARDSVGEDIGVLDIWCSLTINASVMPTIHRAMRVHPSASAWLGPRRSGSTGGRPAADREVSQGLHRAGRERRSSTNSQQNATRTQAMPSYPPALQSRHSAANDDRDGSVTPSCRYDDEVQACHTSMSNRRPSPQTEKSNPTSDLGHKGEVSFEWPALRRESSGNNEVLASIRSTEQLKQALERNVQNSVTRLPKMDDDAPNTRSSIGSVSNENDSYEQFLKNYKRNRVPSLNKLMDTSKKSVTYTDSLKREEPLKESSAASEENNLQSIDITILWLALNEECDAMLNPSIRQLYVAYSFLGRKGADLETPFSLPKPKHYADKCYFNFKKTFHLRDSDLPLLGHMARCRAGSGSSRDPRDCLVFTIVSEPPEDPLGLNSCQDLGYAYLYMGDVLSYSGGSGGYTEVIGLHGVQGGVCGVLAVRVDKLHVLRQCLSFSHSPRRQSRIE